MTTEDSCAKEISELLAASLGRAKATEALETAANQLKLDLDRVDLSEGMMILKKLELEPGLVGIVARLAKARLRLKTCTGRS